MSSSKGRWVSVDTWFYIDPYIQKLAASEWPIYKYCLDGPQRNAYGIYEVSLESMAFHTRYDETEILRALDKFGRAGKIHYVDPGWIVVKKHFIHNPISPKQEWLINGLRTLLESLPDGMVSRLTDKGDPLFIPYLYANASLLLGKDYPNPTLATLTPSLTQTPSMFPLPQTQGARNNKSYPQDRGKDVNNSELERTKRRLAKGKEF